LFAGRLIGNDESSGFEGELRACAPLRVWPDFWSQNDSLQAVGGVAEL
jgi:hypothetical protein